MNDRSEIERLARAVDRLERRLDDLQGYILEFERTRPRGRVRALWRALTWWSVPRIGKLHQHGPRPLRVPSSYLRTEPPEEPPTISIVTPSFNQGGYLERTLCSVLAQDYPRLEYVVQDGGSDDGTQPLLERYGSRLTAWRSEPDRGQADAINRGFERTGGDVMAWLNSDDLLLPGALSYVSRYFAEHPEIDVVYGQRVLIDERDRRIGLWITPRHDDRAMSLVDCVPQETLFWRRSAWEAGGARLDPDFKYALDWDLLLRMARSGARFARLPRLLGAFRVHSLQKTTSVADVGKAEIRLLRERELGERLTDEEAWDLIRGYLRRHVLSHTLYRAGERLPRPRTDVGDWLAAAVTR